MLRIINIIVGIVPNNVIINKMKIKIYLKSLKNLIINSPKIEHLESQFSVDKNL